MRWLMVVICVLMTAFNVKVLVSGEGDTLTVTLVVVFVLSFAHNASEVMRLTREGVRK